MNKYTIEDYIRKCDSMNLEYVRNHKESKKGTVIEYIYRLHKDKGVQNTDWGHLRHYKGCPYCSGRYKTNEDIYSVNDTLIVDHSDTE